MLNQLWVCVHKKNIMIIVHGGERKWQPLLLSTSNWWVKLWFWQIGVWPFQQTYNKKTNCSCRGNFSTDDWWVHFWTGNWWLNYTFNGYFNEFLIFGHSNWVAWKLQSSCYLHFMPSTLALVIFSSSIFPFISSNRY